MTDHTLRISIFSLAWRQGWRDFRAGELRLLMVAVTLAVAALTAVGFFANRLEAALARDAGALLGGDAVVASDQPAPPAFAERAKALGLRQATSASFPSMARAPDDRGGEARLVSVKAVSAGYPLRGVLRLRSQADGPVQDVAAAPDPGTVWVEAGVLDTLQLNLGDSLLLGDARFTISRLLVQEPDRGSGFLGFSPRVLLRDSDLPATGLVQPASRITHRLMVAATGNRGGADPAVREFLRWAEAQVAPAPDAAGAARLRGVRVESLEGGRPEMQQTLERAERFLNLVALLAALLAAVAVAIAARDYAQRHLDDCAMLRVLGTPQRSMGRGLCAGAAGGGPAGQRGGRAAGLCGALRVRQPAVRPAGRAAATGHARPGGVRPGGGADACWPPSACRRCCSWRGCRRCVSSGVTWASRRAASAGVLLAGTAGLCGAAAGGVVRPAHGPAGRGRLRGRGGGVRVDGLGWR